MKSVLVHKNFRIIAKALREHVRHKAYIAGNTIVYLKDGQIIEEDPVSSKKKILRQLSSK
jgi:hypothetical protein